MYIEIVDGSRLLRPAVGKVLTNAANEFYSEGVYMGINSNIEDFVEADPPAAPEDPLTEIVIIKDRIDKTDEMLAQTNADMSSFFDYYFSINPE